jgi:hypothetical protein
VDALNRELGIPTSLAALQEADVPALARAALHEAHTGYPVPRYMTQEECEAMIRDALPPRPAAAVGAAKPAGRRSGARSPDAGRPPAAGASATRSSAAAASAPRAAAGRPAVRRGRGAGAADS